jgi:hypothetical protein
MMIVIYFKDGKDKFVVVLKCAECWMPGPFHDRYGYGWVKMAELILIGLKKAQRNNQHKMLNKDGEFKLLAQ